MPRSKKPSQTNITRDDIRRLKEKYRNDKPTLRRLLRAIFAKPENIHLFGWFINKRYVELETPEFHKEILRIAADKRIRRAAFVAPRGHAKSTTVNFTFALWSACYEQHRFCVIISDTYTQSEEFVNALKDEFEENTLLKWLYGDLVGDKVWRDGEIVLSSGIKFIAKGARQKIRGIKHRSTRPDLMIFDDIENDENVESAEQRKKLYKWFTKAVLQALSRDGRAILVGTILHFDSLVNKVAQKSDVFVSWETRVYYAININNGKLTALWPEHMSIEKLVSIRDNPNDEEYIGSLTFAQEYMHKPFDEADAIIQPGWIQWADSRPAANTIVARAQGVDPAAGEKQRNDPTGQVVAELDVMGNVYVFYASDKRLSPSKNATDMRRVYDTYEPTALGIEAGVLELVFRDLLAGMAVIPQKPDKDKVRRLLAVSRFFEAGRIYFVQGGRGVQDLYNQLMEFPSGSHDDMVDAMVYAIRMLLVNHKASTDDVQEAGDYSKVGQDPDDFDDDDDDDF